MTRKFVITEKAMRVGKIIIDNPKTSVIYKDENMVMTKTLRFVEAPGVPLALAATENYKIHLEGFLMFSNGFFCNLNQNEMFKVGTLNGVNYIGFHENRHIFAVGPVFSDNEDEYFNIMSKSKSKIISFIDNNSIAKNRKMMRNLGEYINKFKKTGREI